MNKISLNRNSFSNEVLENAAADSSPEESAAASAEQRSAVAEQLDRLRGATLEAISTRERLPQPLFWSLFHAELENIKRKRLRERKARAALYCADWL